MIISHLQIRHPIILKGSPCTILEIINGNILIDFRNFIDIKLKGYFLLDHPDLKCAFKELNIVFKLECEKIFTRILNNP